MTGTGQFCAVARSLDILGGRWTLLVVRELLCGSRRFNDIRRGIPRISRTVLSERLQSMVVGGVVERRDGPHGPEYSLTSAGLELANVVGALGQWGQRWLPRDTRTEQLDLEPVLLDMKRRVDFAALPKDPLIVRLELDGQRASYLLLRPSEASLCSHNPGYPEAMCLSGPLAALAAWWRGDESLVGAQRMGLRIAGPRGLIRAFPTWFLRYAFAGVKPSGQDFVPPAARRRA